MADRHSSDDGDVALRGPYAGAMPGVPATSGKEVLPTLIRLNAIFAGLVLVLVLLDWARKWVLKGLDTWLASHGSSPPAQSPADEAATTGEGAPAADDDTAADNNARSQSYGSLSFDASRPTRVAEARPAPAVSGTRGAFDAEAAFVEVVDDRAALLAAKKVEARGAKRRGLALTAAYVLYGCLAALVHERVSRRIGFVTVSQSAWPGAFRLSVLALGAAVARLVDDDDLEACVFSDTASPYYNDRASAWRWWSVNCLPLSLLLAMALFMVHDIPQTRHQSDARKANSYGQGALCASSLIAACDAATVACCVYFVALAAASQWSRRRRRNNDDDGLCSSWCLPGGRRGGNKKLWTPARRAKACCVTALAVAAGCARAAVARSHTSSSSSRSEPFGESLFPYFVRSFTASAVVALVLVGLDQLHDAKPSTVAALVVGPTAVLAVGFAAAFDRSITPGALFSRAAANGVVDLFVLDICLLAGLDYMRLVLILKCSALYAALVDCAKSAVLVALAAALVRCSLPSLQLEALGVIVECLAAWVAVHVALEKDLAPGEDRCPRLGGSYLAFVAGAGSSSGGYHLGSSTLTNAAVAPVDDDDGHDATSSHRNHHGLRGPVATRVPAAQTAFPIRPDALGGTEDAMSDLDDDDEDERGARRRGPSSDDGVEPHHVVSNELDPHRGVPPRFDDSDDDDDDAGLATSVEGDDDDAGSEQDQLLRRPRRPSYS